MKKALILVPFLLLAVLALSGCGTSAANLNNKGNEAFAGQDYEAALTAYQEAQAAAPEAAEPYYNTANTRYRQGAYDQAQQSMKQALTGEQTVAGLDQQSYYNLGDTFFQAQQYGMAIEAYKEALRLNPDDLEAKQNLELALRRQQQQEQQQQEQQQQDEEQQPQDQQNQDQNAGENQDQPQDQQSQDQNQGENQQEQQNQDQASTDQQMPQDQDQNSEQAGGQPQQVEGLSEEQAQQLFEAAAEGTESLEEALQQIMVFPSAPPAEDW
jgi:Ca-activated chloride channel family protein